MTEEQKQTEELVNNYIHFLDKQLDSIIKLEGANAALMKYIGSFMSGPWGWTFAAVTTVWGFMGPNKDASLKGVAIVAYMRKKMSLGY